MSIFFKNYARPGRGISEEEAKKRTYFGILGRKLTKIFQSSLVYSLSNIVFFAAIIFFLLPLSMPADDAASQPISEYLINVFQGKVLVPITIFIPFLFMGPSAAGLTYIMRNFSRQEHAFVWSDFWTYLKKNLKQAILTSIIMTVVFYAYINAVIFYLNSSVNYFIVVILAVNIGLLLLLSSFYIFPIMITFDMKLSQIFKNSLLLAMLYLPKNLLVLVILFIVHLMLMTFALPIWAFLSVIFLFGWSSYTINYVTWEAIEKYMMPKDN